MSALRDIVLRRIAQGGPLSLHEYMALCLGHPQHGYYIARDPLGAAGDFTTAPEISQMFGELLGLCLAQSWLDQGSPAPFVLAELGPGRGTLMKDMLRAARAAPGFLAAAQICLVETSPVLRARQAEALTGYAPRWFDRIDDLPDLPLFLAANEFFDALPIRQFELAEDGWRERMVGAVDGRLALRLGPVIGAGAAGEAPGLIRERCAMGEGIAAQIGARLTAHGGAAAIVDYGYDETPGALVFGDTFQAMRGHAYADPFAAPGEADLTAHVNFAALAAAAKPARPSAVIGQGALLARLGIGARAQALAARGDPEAVAAALERLTAPDQMGVLFKALAIAAPGAPLPPGFDERLRA